jgi:hypothetical protein
MRKISVILFFSVFIFACKKSSDIGGNILPIDDLLNSKFSDTATVWTKTIADEAQRTDNMQVNFLGCIQDANLGRSNASIVAELFRPLGMPSDSAGPFTLDSAVLFLRYVSYYGDTTVPQTFTVSTINNKINENNSYFSDETNFMAVTEIGRVNNYTFGPTQKVKTATTDTVGSSGVLRIPISSSFANTIVALIGDSTLKDSTQFKNFLPGIIVQNEGTSGNCIVQLSLSDAKSKLSFFITEGDGDKVEMYLPANELAIVNSALTTRVNSINLYSKNYTGTNVPSALASADVSDSVTYVLGQGGLLTKVSFPNLMNFGRVAVNKAILEVTQYQPNNAFLPPPNSLYLSRKTSGEYKSLVNYGVVAFAAKDTLSVNPLGGRYVKYYFNITGYVQDVLFGRDSNTDIYINTHLHPDKTSAENVLSAFGYTPSGIVFGGGNLSDPVVKAKLRLTYSPVK